MNQIFSALFIKFFPSRYYIIYVKEFVFVDLSFIEDKNRSVLSFISDKNINFAEKREVGGLLNLATYQDVNRMLVITKDEERTIGRDGHTIEVVPIWKWLLAMN